MFDQSFWMMPAILCQSLPKNDKIKGEFQNVVNNYKKNDVIVFDNFLERL